MITYYQQIQELKGAYSITDAAQIASLKRWYSMGAKKVKNRLRRQVAAEAITTDLTADVESYQLPEYMSRVFGAVYNADGSKWPLKEVSSIYKWNLLKSGNGQSGTPTHYHVVGSDQIELWPKPSDNVTDGLLVQGNFRQASFNFDDVTTGTATLTTDSEVVTLSSSVVTTSWVGKFFQTTDGSHEFTYKISEYVSPTSFKLDQYYAGAGGAGHTYIVGDVVDIPEEYLDIASLYAESKYVSIYRKNRSQGNDMMAEFKESLRMINQDFANPSSSRVVKADREDLTGTVWWPTEGLS